MTPQKLQRITSFSIPDSHFFSTFHVSLLIVVSFFNIILQLIQTFLSKSSPNDLKKRNPVFKRTMFCMFKFQFMKVNSLFLKCNRVKIWFCCRIKNTKASSGFPRHGCKTPEVGGANLLFSKPFAENGMNMK